MGDRAPNAIAVLALAINISALVWGAGRISKTVEAQETAMKEVVATMVVMQRQLADQQASIAVLRDRDERRR